jgi:hypothetical protein
MKKLYFIITILLVFLMAACNKDEAMIPNDLDKIKLEFINHSTSPVGNSYAIKLTNGSKHVIKQNVVYLSYPLKLPNGQMGNKFKIEAIGNKLDIKPNEVINLNVFAPIQEYENNKNLVLDTPDLQIIGYIDDVTAEHQFSIGGGVPLDIQKG